MVLSSCVCPYVHGGYWLHSFIRSDGKQWLRFDDDRVSREDQRNALDAQFGKKSAVCYAGGMDISALRNKGLSRECSTSMVQEGLEGGTLISRRRCNGL